jgi:hypothetical protein
MSIFVDAARLIANLGGLSQNIVGVKDPKSSGEFRAASITGLAADVPAAGLFGFMRATKDADYQSKARRYGDAARVSPILLALNIVEGLELTTGFGSPHEGDDLRDGAKQFSKIYEQLGSIFPDDSWQGSASQAYSKQNTDLQGLAKKMQEHDATLAAIVKDHADFLTHTHLVFGILKDALIVGFIIELIIKFSLPQPPLGATPSLTFAKVVAVLGVSIAAGMLGALLGSTTTNADKADTVAAEYGAVAADAYKLSVRLLAAKPEVPAAEQSTVSSFEDISAGMPKMSAPPQAPVSAGVASGSGAERPLLSALSGDGDTRGDGSSEIAETLSAPGFTMPTLAQVSAMSGQAAKLSGQLSQHANVVNQAMGQIQQIAQMAQQGKEAAAPAKEAAPKEAALAGAAPAEAAERAPIEAAPVGAAQTTDEPQRAL